MNKKNLLISQAMISFSMFGLYSVSGYLGYLVIGLGSIWFLIYTFKPTNFNLFSYYVASLGILSFQSLLLIYTYLFRILYLQNNPQYIIYILGIISFIITFIVFLQSILKKNL